MTDDLAEWRYVRGLIGDAMHDASDFEWPMLDWIIKHAEAMEVGLRVLAFQDTAREATLTAGYGLSICPKRVADLDDRMEVFRWRASEWIGETDDDARLIKSPWVSTPLEALRAIQCEDEPSSPY